MIYLREAEQTDIELLFAWANDPVVRQNSFTTDPIPYEDHRRWFQRIMADDKVLQYIMMDDENPVGQIRLNLENDTAEIGYSIAVEYRGRGYGHKILRLIVDEVKEQHPEIKTLIAKVKPENLASKKLFESEGYEMKYSCYSLDTMCGGVLRAN